MVRIFLADHHVLIRGGLRTLIRARRDFSICGEASNGIEAVKLAIQAKPDFVVMEVNLLEIKRHRSNKTDSQGIARYRDSDFYR